MKAFFVMQKTQFEMKDCKIGHGGFFLPAFIKRLIFNRSKVFKVKEDG